MMNLHFKKLTLVGVLLVAFAAGGAMTRIFNQEKVSSTNTSQTEQPDANPTIILEPNEYNQGSVKSAVSEKTYIQPTTTPVPVPTSTPTPAPNSNTTHTTDYSSSVDCNNLVEGDITIFRAKWVQEAEKTKAKGYGISYKCGLVVESHTYNYREKVEDVIRGTLIKTCRETSSSYQFNPDSIIEKYMQNALVSCPTVVPSATPTPCICIEAWGAGGFMGLCSTVPSHCKILYSCLLSDGKRYGVWNDKQTICLEQYVRNKGEWP